MSLLLRQKKFISRVLPGLPEVRATFFRPVSELIRLDFPTFDRPAKAISGSILCGRPSILTAPVMNWQSFKNKRRPFSSASFEFSSEVSSNGFAVFRRAIWGPDFLCLLPLHLS